jgi:hypothetical protein
MIAAAGATFHASDRTVAVQRGDDVFTNLLALSTIRVHIAPKLRAFNYAKRILQHYFYSVSLFFVSAEFLSLFQPDVPPLAADDQIANLRRALSFFAQLINKEPLLETELSGGAVFCGEAVEQAAMLFSRVAITVTRLLGEDFGVLPRVVVNPGHHRVGKTLRVQYRRERPGLVNA